MPAKPRESRRYPRIVYEILKKYLTKPKTCVIIIKLQGPLAQLVRVLAWHARGHWFESSCLHQQKTHFCLSTKVRFLNDVCLRQMMTDSPNDVRCANDVCLTAHWANIASLRHKVALHHICAANASYRQRRYIIEKYSILWYNKTERGWSAWKFTVLKENGQDRFGCDSRSIIALLVWICLQQPRYQRLSTQIPRKQKTMIFLLVTPIW